MIPASDNRVDGDLTRIYEEAMKAANASWTETDKLYVSVCSALIALAALFGGASDNYTLTVLLGPVSTIVD